MRGGVVLAGAWGRCVASQFRPTTSNSWPSWAEALAWLLMRAPTKTNAGSGETAEPIRLWPSCRPSAGRAYAASCPGDRELKTGVRLFESREVADNDSARRLEKGRDAQQGLI